MLFTDPVFLFYFLPACLLGHFVLLRLRGRNEYGGIPLLFLFATSLLFFSYSQTWFLIPFAICVCFDFAWASLLSRSRRDLVRKTILAFAIAQNLSLFALLKYLDFIRELLGTTFPSYLPYLPQITLNEAPLLLPCGISFYTFESLSFIIDVYRRKIEPPRNPMRFFGFIGMFPRFVSGPIVRYADLDQQFSFYRGMRLEEGIPLFIHGLFLKCCFADSFAIFTAYAFEPGPAEMISSWIATIAYSMQIYLDFSGYSLMAIGLGKCFGFDFPQNFDRPYLATSFRQFWQRWHMTLSAWMRDYVYIPLGGSRQHPLRNVFLTMLVSGLWHGAGLTFVAWGLWHGTFLCAEKYFRWEERLPSWAKRVTLGFVVLHGWVLFRAPTLKVALQTFAAMYGLKNPHAFNPGGLLAHPSAITWCLLGFLYVFFLEGRRLTLPRFAYLGELLVALLWGLSNGTVPFIYFQF